MVGEKQRPHARAGGHGGAESRWRGLHLGFEDVPRLLDRRCAVGHFARDGHELRAILRAIEELHVNFASVAGGRGSGRRLGRMRARRPGRQLEPRDHADRQPPPATSVPTNPKPRADRRLSWPVRAPTPRPEARSCRRLAEARAFRRSSHDLRPRRRRNAGPHFDNRVHDGIDDAARHIAAGQRALIVGVGQEPPFRSAPRACWRPRESRAAPRLARACRVARPAR